MNARFRRTFAVLSGATLAAVGGIGIPASISVAVDMNDRAAVIASYDAEFNRVEPDAQWTGSVATCTPGTTSVAYQQSVLQRVNWFRDLAGLPPVRLEPANSQYSQAAALISAAENKLTHYPASTARCYSADGAKGAGNSSLALGGSGVTAINMYMNDYGDNNKPVGHRSWLLAPNLATVAPGDVIQKSNTSGHWSSNALYQTLSSPGATPRDGAVAWPPRGFVPYQVVYDRWSYHRGGADFSSATVSVTGPDGPVPVTIDDRKGWLGPGIVFVPALPEGKPSGDRAYEVSISGIGGTGPSSVAYTVTIVAVNNVPYLNNTEVAKVNACAAEGTRVLFAEFADDDDSDYEKLSLSISGADADHYKLSQTGEVELVRPIDPKKRTHQFTLTATDPQGATISKDFTYTYRKITSRTVCPARTVTTKVRGRSIVVSWKKALGKTPANGYYAFVAGTMQGCVTRRTSCVIRLSAKGSYLVYVETRDSSRNVRNIPIRVKVR